MNPILNQWEAIFESKIGQLATAEDPAHDLMHFKRVVKTAKALAAIENARMDIVVPAAWLHDMIIIPKSDPRRSHASKLSAAAALEFLRSVGYPDDTFGEIAHAIECHSFSANIPAKTLEAKIVQDADRLDGLGAIGVARCFATGALMKRPFYAPNDPFCKRRDPDDQEFTVDHFFKKLFRTVETLQTVSGKEEGLKRAERMRRFLSDLSLEIG